MKRKVPPSAALLALLVALNACGHRREVLDPSSNRVGQPGLISVWADWVKDKGDKFDIQLNLKNESERSLIVSLHAMRCYRGEHEGKLKHTFFNTGEKLIDLRPGDSKDMRLVCTLDGETRGEFRIVIDRVFDNPTSDGVQTGEVLARDLQWRHPG